MGQGWWWSTRRIPRYHGMAARAEDNVVLLSMPLLGVELGASCSGIMYM